MNLTRLYDSGLLKKPWERVECALCKRPVERVDSFANSDRDSYIFRFFCHGSREEVEITAQEAMGDISLGRAFGEHATASRMLSRTVASIMRAQGLLPEGEKE